MPTWPLREVRPCMNRTRVDGDSIHRLSQGCYGPLMLWSIFRCLFGCISFTVVWLYRGILVIIKGLFSGICMVFMFLKQCLCCGGRSAEVMMKAPGMAGRIIARSVFEANTQAYFLALRAGTLLGRWCSSSNSNYGWFRSTPVDVDLVTLNF